MRVFYIYEQKTVVFAYLFNFFFALIPISSSQSFVKKEKYPPYVKKEKYPRFSICHGYDCYYRTQIQLNRDDVQKIRKIFLHVKNAQAEREAIKKAFVIYEERATRTIGVRDEPKMAFGRPHRKGQMDCIDESKNSEIFLKYLKANAWLKFHNISRRDSSGFFLDGRYPHWTAVILDTKGEKWVVDSWYEPGGGAPDIMPLKEWKKRGVGGKR